MRLKQRPDPFRWERTEEAKDEKEQPNPHCKAQEGGENSRFVANVPYWMKLV
jgi:hypothetical protein